MCPADLARETNIPVTTVHRLVTDKSTKPYPSTIETIAKYFGKSVEKLKDASNGKALLSNLQIRNIPLVQWDNIKHRIASTTFPIHNISEARFALKINDSSVEPLFPKDSILIFESIYNLLSDISYVLVQLGQNATHVYLGNYLL